MKKITKIAIFDFDGTLVSTELPITGKQKYLDKTGKEWPHQGWWGKAESLDTDIFETPLVKMVKEAYDEMKLEDETLMVMLTGRMIKLSTHVEKILEEHGLEFDEYHYNKGGATDVAKMKTMDMLLDKFPEADDIVLWDDRIEHIPVFHEFLKAKVQSGRLKTFNITEVPADRH